MNMLIINTPKKYITRILCMIIFCCLLFFNVSVNADSSNWVYNESGQVLYLYEIEDSKAVITAGGNLNDVIIPEYIEGYPVTQIASRAFMLNPYYTSITLPETLITIEDEAILSCENIKDITIPRSVQKIGLHALGYEIEFFPINNNQDYIEFYEKMNDFVIKGYTGTAAETYAKNNGFTFIDLDEPDVTTTTSTTTTATTETTVTTATTPDITTNIKGDANGDGRLAAGDAAFIAKKLAEASVSGEEITVEKYPDADFNGDGKVTAADAADIAGYLAELVLKNKI